MLAVRMGPRLTRPTQRMKYMSKHIMIIMHLCLSVLICTCGHVTSSCLLACSPMAQWPKCQRVRPVAALPIPSLGHLVHQPRHPIGVAVRETRILFTPDLIRHQGSQMFAVFTMKNMLKSLPETSSRPRHPRCPIPKLFQTFHVKNASFSNLQIFTSGWRWGCEGTT